MHPTKDDCYTTSVKYCACIEFHLDEERRRGFHTSQLIDYTLEPNPDADENKNAPPQKLVLTFSTVDVVISGWRLGRLADLLGENELAKVHVLPRRYANLDNGRPYVASIIIRPIGRSQS